MCVSACMCRPFRIVVQDVKLLGSTELRDVFAATATHIMTAFGGQKAPPKPSSFMNKQDRCGWGIRLTGGGGGRCGV